MKVSEMIRNLKVFIYEHGDLDCWYYKKDEDNSYGEVCCAPDLIYIDEYGIVYTDDDFIDVKANELPWLTPVCVVN